MRRITTLVLFAGMAAVLSGLKSQTPLMQIPIAHAAQSWGIVVGGDPAPGITDINYYPRTLTIDAGDSVSWTFPSKEPHTVTFDAGAVPGLFLTGIAPDEPGKGDFDVTTAFSPVNADAPALSYDGTKALSSGVSLDPPDERAPFVATFPKAGVYHFECAVHGPEMAGDIVVLPSGAATPETPAQAQARGTAEAAFDLTYTMAAAEAFASPPPTTPTASGATIHALNAGMMGFHLAVAQYLPPDYSVKRGDYITWNQPDINEFHTVTFLAGSAPPPFIQIVPHPGGAPDIFLPAAVMVPAGGTTFTGSNMVNSGTLGGGGSFTLRIDAPPGKYEYVCLFHADDFNMKGTITVTP